MTWLAPQEGRITSGQLLLLQHLVCCWQEKMLFLPSGRKEFGIWGNNEEKVKPDGKGHMKQLVNSTFALMNHLLFHILENICKSLWSLYKSIGLCYSKFTMGVMHSWPQKFITGDNIQFCQIRWKNESLS